MVTEAMPDTLRVSGPLDPPYFPQPGDPWFNADVLHRARHAVIRGIVKTVPEPDATWRRCVLDRAFWQCLEYARPDEFAPYLDELYREAMKHSGTTALHMAQELVRTKALALGNPDRDW